MEPKISEKCWSKEFEKPIYSEWKAKNTYGFVYDSEKPIYSIDTPPPYVNTPIHIGHAATYVLMDMFARFRRMIGYNVLFPLGLDRNGLPIEMAAEKRFNVKFNEVSREEFLEMCKTVLEEASTESVDSFLRFGIGFNSWKQGEKIGDMYLTDSDDYRALTQDTFIELYEKGLIYEDERINNYCPGCQTTLADAEIEYTELPTKFNDVIFKVKETGEKIVIGTTRPELICTCGMVIFNPADKRYKHLEGKTAITPIFEKEVPIISHPMADPEKGTGLVMMCSAGDTSDIRFFREMSLTPIIAIGIDGTMNEHAGFLKGLKVSEARERMIEELKRRGLLVKQRSMMHRTPICERSKDQIEFIAMKEFYLKQVEFKEKMLLLADMINFYDPASKQIYINWVKSISIDWPISRRRYYATEVPVWWCKSCGSMILPPKGKYYKPWKEKAPVDKCKKCGSKEFVGDERVFDTWFDSAISPLYILKWSRQKEFFEKNSRCSLRPQGKEIVRTWLYYTLLKCYLLTGEAIFKDVWINYHIIDEHGKKMSKSLGNVINPHDVLEQYGAEPFRLWTVTEGSLEKQDLRCSFERIGGASKTLTKLWNIARFISMFPEPKKNIRFQATDKWIIQELNALIKNARTRYEKYDFHTPVTKIKHFIWETFSSNYVELVKGRAYNDKKIFREEEQNAAVFTLYYCLNTIIKMLAPVIPMFCYYVYKTINGEDVHFVEFPKVEMEFKVEFSTEELVELNSRIWKAKKENGLSLKAEVKRLRIPEKFKEIANDFREAHNVKTLEYGDFEIVL